MEGCFVRPLFVSTGSLSFSLPMLLGRAPVAMGPGPRQHDRFTVAECANLPGLASESDAVGQSARPALSHASQREKSLGNKSPCFSDAQTRAMVEAWGRYHGDGSQYDHSCA